MLTALCLPLRFDLSRLQADLAAIPSSDWSPHYNERDYGGEWRGAALRSASGAPGDLRSVAPQFHDTPLLDRCPYFREVLSAFPCALRAVRLLGLAPGSFIREHTDDALDMRTGWSVFTSPSRPMPGSSSTSPANGSCSIQAAPSTSMSTCRIA